MKRTLYWKKIAVLGILAIALPMGLASCDDSVRTSALTIDTAEKASVTAMFYADIDKTQLGMEYAPDNTPVVVSVNYSDLNPAAGSGSWRDTLHIQNGAIEVEVPVSSAGSTVSFFPDEFIMEQIQPHGSNAETVTKIYRVPGSVSTLANVRPGQNRFHEVTYTDQNVSSHSEVVDIRFQGMVLLEEHYQDPDSLVHIPSGTEVTLFTNEWAESISVGSNGTFETSVPANESIQIEFEAQKTIQSDEDTIETFNYKFTAVAGPFQSSTPVLQAVNFGGGSLWE